MSYIDVLILRQLARGPAHGYELRKQVEAGTGYVLHNNSLYPALRRMEEAGAVIKTAQVQEKRPPRHVYEITETGRDLLHDLLAELPPESAADEAEFLCRVAHFDLLTPGERLAVLDARDKAVEARMAHLRSLDEGARGDRWGSLVTREMIRRGESEQAWLRELRTRAEEGT